MTSTTTAAPALLRRDDFPRHFNVFLLLSIFGRDD